MKKYRFRNWLRNVLFHFDAERDEESKAAIMRGRPLSVRDSESSLDSDPIRINIYTANGGMIVETKTYDRQRDRNTSQLYIINSDEDLGDQLSKIVTMVSLGR